MSNDDSSQTPASSPPSNSSSSSTPAGPPPSNSSSSSSSPPSSPPPSNSSSSSPPPSSPPPSSPPPSSPPPSSSPPPQSSSSPPPQSSSSPPPQSSSSPPPQSSSSPSPPKSSSSPPPQSPPPTSSSPSGNGQQRSPPSSNVFSPPPPANSGTAPATKSPPSSVSPPPPTSSTSSPSSGGGGGGETNNSDILMYTIIGGVGFVILLLALVIICAVRSRKKRKQLQHKQMQFYGEHKGHGDPYYGQHPNWHGPPQGGDHQNWHSYPQGGDKLPVPPGGGWPSATPPPPPMISSGEMSSNFSGPVRPPLPPPSPNIALGFNKSTFTYDELAAATEGFSQANLLGQGGFGYVHKGVLPTGKEIAVKSLKTGSGQGEREFQAEVEIISRVHHRHLVSLVGYCIAGGQRMLVYEFVPNDTLEHHLHGKGQPVMDWASRLRIALGSAKGLAYLHEDCHPKIIHRDIKAANILLDLNFEAMVADFGLAKLSSDTHTHVSTRVMGTFGYLAPEYASSGKLTEKSDVFSFGVMLLELVTGRKPVDPSMMDDSLVDWARPYVTEALEFGKYDGLVDPRLENNFAPHEMARMVACAAASVRHSARKRPKMSQIVRALEGDSSLDDLNDGVRPGQSSIYGSSTSTEYSQSSYNADLKKFRKMALGSQEFSSEYAGSSGDSREMATPTPGTEKHNKL